MKLHFFEASNGGNWGKFAVGVFEAHEWAVQARIDGAALIAGRGWDGYHVLFLDLQTGEGTMLRPGGSVDADLKKHAVWLCPMAAPFLRWLYPKLAGKPGSVLVAQLEQLVWSNPVVTLSEEEAPFSFRGSRGPGLDNQEGESNG